MGSLNIKNNNRKRDFTSNKFIDDEKIVELYKQGLLHKEIAKILDYGISTVTNHLIKMGYTTYTINKDDVIRLYNEGYTDLEISQMLNLSLIHI